VPFNKETAVNLGSKGGSNRWKGKDPATNRKKTFLIKMTLAEFEALNEKAKALELSRAELIIQAVKAYDKEESCS